MNLLCTAAVLVALSDGTLAYQNCTQSIPARFEPDRPVVTAKDCEKKPKQKGCENG
jgi:hypothetical protein